jgi:hypothetical protein
MPLATLINTSLRALLLVTLVSAFLLVNCLQFGLLPPDMYSSYSNSRAEAEYTFVEMNKQLNEGEPPKVG